VSEIRVFTARRIHTFNPSWPTATAVAVRDGTIVETGSLDTLAPWLAAYPHVIDRSLEDRVLLPGLIDPHLHPAMAAVLLPMRFVTALEWRLPWETVRPVSTPEAFVARLAELDRSMADPAEPLFVWGYHPLWHGIVRRPHLDAVSATRPMVVWHRSFHELVMNSAMLAQLDLTAAKIGQRQQIDIAGGHFYENGLGYAINRLNPILLAPDRFRLGLERLRQVAHFGGHTTIGDMAVGIFDFETELAGMRAVLDQDDVPFRTELVAHATRLRARLKATEQDTRAFMDHLPERNSHRLRFDRRVKLFTDGAFFSQLAMLQPPGYVDGHHGEWITVPDAYREQAREYWHAGYRIHVHCTGDLGLELAIDTLEQLQWERPRFRHGYTIEHFGFSTPEQVERLAALGANVSANVYYLHELGETYARNGIGMERAAQMARLGACVRSGITTALHSDFTMAPALPLNSAWVAANRITCEGRVFGPNERLTVEQALRAVTIDAAKVLGIEQEVGSIRAGKRADFTVLDRDPYEVGAEGLRDLRVLATIFEGTLHEVQGFRP